MADRAPVRTQALTRDEIAAFTRSPRQVRFFEALTSDVEKTLPDSTLAAASAAEAAQDAAEAAQTSADSASIDAANAQQRADEAFALATTFDAEPSISVLHAELQQLRARVAALEQGITA